MIDHHQPVGAGLCNLTSIILEIYAKPAIPISIQSSYVLQHTYCWQSNIKEDITS
jgi:hypothetical protein